MYHGAQDWLVRLDARGDLSLSLFEELSAEGLADVLDDEVDVVWIETPTNPTWDVIDIAAAARATHRAGGVLVVDSTVAPPVTTRPLGLGADFVFQSATKYLNGHSDVTAGALTSVAHHELWDEIQEVRIFHGSVLSPFDAWLLMRGLRTLGVRYRRASESALAIATHFVDHPAIEKVLYPGIPSNPGYAAATSQMSDGFGGMLSILVKGGEGSARRLATNTRLFTTATSLGGTESLIEHRASVEGPNSIVAKNLVRVSVGLENPDDLIADLEQALKGIT
jgi:cystathionine gamma-synthase